MKKTIHINNCLYGVYDAVSRHVHQIKREQKKMERKESVTKARCPCRSKND